MKLDQTYISDKNSYAGQKPIYLVVHNTDNYHAGADARSHAKAQHDGNFHGMSAHVYVDDKEAYQALPFSRGAWHVGVDYGGRLFGIVNNRNSVGIEMCVQKGCDYESAFQNTVQICQKLMKELGIPANRVVQHYDVCGKNCPSAIRARGDWTRFQNALRKGEGTDGMEESKQKADQTEPFTISLPEISRGCSGSAVSVLQAFLQTKIDGSFGKETEQALETFQKHVRLIPDGICGENTWKAVAVHMRENTFSE